MPLPLPFGSWLIRFFQERLRPQWWGQLEFEVMLLLVMPRQRRLLMRRDFRVELRPPDKFQLYVRWLTWVMLFLAHQWLLRLPHMGQMVEPTKGLMRLGLLMDRGKKALPLKHLLPMRLFLQLLD